MVTNQVAGISQAIQTLIKAGAFDSLKARRSQLLAALDRALQSGAAVLADRRSGQKSLFGIHNNLPITS